MKKIIYVTTLSRTINAFLVPHIEELIKSGYKVDLACNVDKPISEVLIKKDVKVYDIPFSRNPLDIKNLKAFRKILKIQKDNKYDIMHVHTPIASIFGRLVKIKFKGLKTIYTAHGYHFFKGSSKITWLIYYPIEKIMARITDVIININTEDYKITQKNFKPKECYLINGVGLDLTKYKKLSDREIEIKKEKLGFDDNDFIIIMIAELNENKNQIQVIKAMEVLRDNYPKIKVILVGEGHKLDELKIEVNKRYLENNISFLGFRMDINELINISNIGVLLSHREGLPRSVMEILANGKKVIGTDVRGIRDIITSKEAGELLAVGDYEKTAKIIEEYYKDFLIGEKNIVPKYIVENFDVENVKKEIMRLI